MYNQVVFRMFTELHDNHQNQFQNFFFFRIFLTPQKKALQLSFPNYSITSLNPTTTTTTTTTTSLHSCLTLCDPIDGSLPGSPIPGILQARTLEWVAILLLTLPLLLLLSSFSRVRLCATRQTAAHQAPPSLGFSRQEHWSGLPFPSPVHESDK